MAVDFYVTGKTKFDDDDFKKGLSSIKAGAVAVTAAVAAISVAAIKASSEFEKSFAKASTLFGDVDVDVKNLTNSVMGISSATGIAATEINEALYNALSAGVKVTHDMSAATDFLSRSAKLAAAGFTDIDTAASATAKVINAYGLDVEDTERIQKVLMQTQNKGITTVGQLGQSLSAVTPTAAAFGVSFENVGSALAGMTAAGTPTAQSTTQLNALIAELGKQGTAAAKNLAAAAEGSEYAGMSFKEMMHSGADLGVVMQLLDGHADETGQTIVDMFGSIEAGKAALAINSSDFVGNMKEMSTEADVVEKAFEKVANTFDYQWGRMVESSKNLGIKIASNFNETVGKGFLKSANDTLEQLSKAFDEGGVGAMGDVALKLIGDLGKSLKESLPELVPIAVGMLVDFVGFMLESIPVIIQLGVDIIHGLAVGLIKAIPVLIEKVPDIINGLHDSFRENGPKLLKQMFELVVDMGKAMLEAIPALIKNMDKIIEMLLNVFNITSFIEMGKKVIHWIGQGMSAAGDFIMKAIAGIFDFFKKTFTLNNFIEFGKKILEGIGFGILAAIGLIIIGVEKVIEVIKNFFNPKTLWENGKNLIIGLIDGLWALLGWVGETIWSVVCYIAQFFNPKTLWENGKNLVIGLAEGIMSLVGFLSEVGHYILSFIAENFNPVALFNHGKNLIIGLANGVMSLVSFISGKAASVLSSIKKNFSPSALYQAGKDLLSGLARGITNGISSAVSAAKKAASNVLSSVKNFFGIKSPSKVFEKEIGVQLPAGMAVGVTKNRSVANEAVKGMADEAITTAKMATYSAGESIYGATEGSRSGAIARSTQSAKDTSVNVEAVIELDGEKVGKLITPRVDTQLGKATKLRLRGAL